MALASYAQATLAELKRHMAIKAVDADVDLRLEDCIGLASLEIEGPDGLKGRRGVYRGPVESFNSIVSAQAISNGALTIAGSPNSAGRTLVVRKTDADRSITQGTLTVSQASPVLVETFDLTQGNELHGVKFFTAAVTAALTGVVGASGADTIDIGTSEGYTELYSPCGHEIRPIEWPVRLFEVREDINRAFGIETVLVEGTDYELRNQDSVLRSIARLLSGLDATWPHGRRVVQARMSAGWKGPAGVPLNVKGVCLELAAWHFQHTDRKEFGLVSRSDDLSTITRSGPPIITTGMKARLGAERREEFGTTAERGWTEAA